MQRHPTVQDEICVSRSRDHAVRISLHGEFDIGNAQQLADCLAVGCSSRRSRIEVDLSRVRFLGIAPAALLIAASARLAATGRHLVVTEMSRQAQRTLELVGHSEAVTVLPGATPCPCAARG